MEIKKLRKQVDAIDAEIVRALNARAKLTVQIGQVKARQGAGVYVPDREKEVYDHIARLNSGPMSREATQSVFREIMSASLALEKPLRIAYQGPPMSFAYLASQRKFGSQATLIDCTTIGEVFVEVERGRADYGVVPIQNSLEGTVGYTLDRLVETDLAICSEVFQPIDHHVAGACPLRRVKRLYLHPQAHAQCRGWIESHLLAVKLVETLSTSMAAAMAHNHARDSVAITSAEAARHYRLKILAKSIGDSSQNITRFLVVGKTPARPTGQDKTSLVFSIKDRVGALHDMLVPFRRHRINLTKIESRPSKRKAWDYYFFVDLEGHVRSPRVDRALRELEGRCQVLKVLGSYPVGE